MSESPSGPQFTYRAFISYSHRDKACADWLHKALETYRVPSRLVGRQTEVGLIPRRLNPVFRDREELSSSPELGSKINAALAQSENLIVICSPASATSRWVNEEVLAYKSMGRAERIFCLIVEGEPDASEIPGRAAEECFCPALRFKLDAKGQPTDERTEPIAADARPGKDGKANAKLKLVAGMLGVGFDALKQREQQRRVRRLTAIAALAVAVMAITSVLAVYALISRHQAVIAQQQAVIAQQAAERRQKQAEDLVGFMLGDLNEKLTQLARVDIMQAVDDKAMAYFKSLPTTDVTDTALAQRAKALEKIGDVRLAQGQLPGALEAFQASTTISSKLAAKAPADVVRQVAYSRTLAYIGLVHWNQGKLDAAQQEFEAALKTLPAPQARAKDEADLLYQRATVVSNLGHLDEARGQFDAAESEYRRSRSLFRELVVLKPDSTDYASNLGDAHNSLGKMALQRGDLATAVADYRADDAIETRLALRTPNDNRQRENVLRVRAILGRTLALAGDLQGGIRDLQAAVDMAEELMKFDPAQTDFQDDVALYATQLARLKRLSGDDTAANALTTRALSILATLAKKDPSNRYWQGDLAGALTEQAAESNAAGQRDLARSKAQPALRTLEPMLAGNPDDRDTLLATMTAKLLLADVFADAQAAKTLRDDALKTLRAQKAGKDDPRLLALQVEALLALGRSADAQPLIKQLWTSGYRDRALVDVLRRARIDYPPNPEFQAKLLAAARGDGDAPPPPATSRQ
ncbi:MAG: TIR domain-containing protein [Lysobacterales bacterium]